MPEHVSNERLSALVEDRTPTEREQRHLEECPDCGRELDRIRRMRMALSAMNDLDAPADGWQRIERSLPEPTESDAGRGAAVGAAPADRGDGSVGRPVWDRLGAWGRVAAAAVLFAGGLTLGSYLGAPASGGDASSPREGAEAARATGPGGAASRAGLGTGSDATSARAGDALAPLESYRDPAAAAERLARLDAMMEATRQALREDPADPTINDLLFQVAEDREELLDALNLATLEYR